MMGLLAAGSSVRELSATDLHLHLTVRLAVVVCCVRLTRVCRLRGPGKFSGVIDNRVAKSVTVTGTQYYLAWTVLLL